jgi:predicted DCC family thiol-disulfide oxidoreductase YuxK
MSNNKTQAILFYDDECILCRRFKQALDLLPASHSILKLKIQDDEIYAKYPQLNKEECFQEIHLIDEFQNILKGPEVVKYLINQHPKVKKFSWLIESDMGKKSVDLFYNSVNQYRERLLKRCPKCKKRSVNRSQQIE